MQALFIQKPDQFPFVGFLVGDDLLYFGYDHADLMVDQLGAFLYSLHQFDRKGNPKGTCEEIIEPDPE